MIYLNDLEHLDGVENYVNAEKRTNIKRTNKPC